MHISHDPYRNTAKRSLQEKASKERKKVYKIGERGDHSPDFWEQSINLSNYYYLPEGLQNIILFTLFMIIPYTTGVLFIFIVVAKTDIETYHQIEMHSFLLSWTIGYEVIASFILLLIIRGAILFKNSP